MNSEINVEVEMDETSIYTAPIIEESQSKVQETFISESKPEIAACSSSLETVITRPINYMNYPQTNVENITESVEQPITETTTVLTDNITVTVTNVSEQEINLSEEPQPETEPPIYISTVNHKDNTSIYLGTNENGDQVYRIKCEPYVEIDYMSLPETTFPPETVYANSEIKPETTTGQPDEIKPEVPTETPEISSEKSSVVSPPSEPKPESSTDEKQSWEVSNSSETIISSSDNQKSTINGNFPAKNRRKSRFRVKC